MAGLFDRIDGWFDKVDNAIDSTNRVINRQKQSTAKVESMRGRYMSSDQREQSRSARQPASSSTAIVAVRYRFVESIDGETGAPTFMVTDGVDRCEVSSRAFAQRICDALNKESR